MSLAAAKEFVTRIFVTKDDDATKNLLPDGDPASNEPHVEDFVRPRKGNQFLPFSRFSDVLPYSAWDPERKLFYIEGNKPDTIESVGFCVEIRPQLGASREMAENLTSLFMLDAPEGTGLMFQIFGTPDLTEYLKYYEKITIRPDTYPPGSEDYKRAEVLYEMAQRRIAHYRKAATEGLAADFNFRVRDFRSCCSVVIPVKKSGTDYPKVDAFQNSPEFEPFMKQVVVLRESIIATLQSYHLYESTWDASDLINWCARLANMQKTLAGEIVKQTYEPSVPVGAQIVSPETRIKESEFDIRFSDGYNAPVVARAMSIRSYPKQFTLHMMGELLGSPSNPALSYPCPFLITMGVSLLNYDKEKNRTILKSARATQSANSQMAAFQPDLQDRKHDWDLALNAFTEGHGTVKLYHQLMLFTPPDKAAAAEQAARSIWRGCGFDLTVDRKMQKQAFIASLPMTFGPLLQNDLRVGQRMSTKTVPNAANLLPTLAEPCGVGIPVMTLFGRRGQAMAYDVFDKQASNPNGAVVGSPGSGKSFCLNDQAARVLAVGGKVRIVDVGRSYENLCKLLYGQHFVFKYDSDICLNPFPMITDIKEDLHLLKPLLCQMISPSGSIADYGIAQLEITILQLWNEFGNAMDITQIAERLKVSCFQGGSRTAFADDTEEELDPSACDPAIRELGVQLFPFTKAGMYGKFFHGQTNMNFDSNLVLLELEELENMKDLQAVVLMMLFYKFSFDMYLSATSRKQRMMVIIDEAWSLLNSDQAATFIEAGYRKARKYMGSFWTGTQSIADYYRSTASQAALTCADWLWMLRQKPDAIAQLKAASRLILSEEEEKLINSLQTKRGLYSEIMVRYGSAPATVGRLIVDPFTSLLFSSAPEDFSAIESYVKSGRSTSEAVLQVMHDRGMGS